MANQGKLAGAIITSTNVWQQIYQVTVSTTASVTINICNQGSDTAQVQIAIPSSTTVNPADIIEYNLSVYKQESFTKTFVLSSGDYVYVKSNAGSVSVNIWGFEE